MRGKKWRRKTEITIHKRGRKYKVGLMVGKGVLEGEKGEEGRERLGVRISHTDISNKTNICQQKNT